MNILTPDKSVETLQSRKILIAINQLGDSSENLIAYSLLVTQNILCDYTVLYSLKKNDKAEITSKKIDNILENLKCKYSFCADKKLNVKIASENLLEATLQFEQAVGINCLMINSSNLLDTHMMDNLAQSILFQVPTNVLVIPPNIPLVFPNNVGVLIEEYEPSNLEKLTAANRFISEYKDIFINFVLFTDSKEILDQDRKALGKYNNFFDSNFKFNFIVQDLKDYNIFFKNIEENHVNVAIIVWNENSPFFKHYLHGKSKQFPCSPKFPVYYPKLKESINNIDFAFIPFIKKELLK